MAKCEICGKGPQFGHNRSHSMVATKRRWNPNVQKVTLMIDGKPKKVRACSRCIRTFSKSKV